MGIEAKSKLPTMPHLLRAGLVSNVGLSDLFTLTRGPLWGTLGGRMPLIQWEISLRDWSILHGCKDWYPQTESYTSPFCFIFWSQEPWVGWAPKEPFPLGSKLKTVLIWSNGSCFPQHGHRHWYLLLRQPCNQWLLQIRLSLATFMVKNWDSCSLNFV